MNYCQTGSPDGFTFFAMLLIPSIELVFLLCVMLAPVGALVCAIMARRRGLSAWRFAGLGAGNMALLLLPWIYTVARLARRRPPHGLVAMAYIILYSAWFIGPIAGLWLLLCVGWSRDSLFWNLKPVIGLLSIVQLVTWVGSMVWLSNRHSALRLSTMPNLVYLQPFILLALWATLITTAFVGSIGS